MAVFAAAGLLWAAMPSALAGDRPATKQSANASVRASVAAQSKPEAGNMERKCVIMSCGTPWCYSVRR